MSLFNSLFGHSEQNSEQERKFNWIPLEHVGQLDELVAYSEQNTVLIFKHSSRCSVSRFALKQFERDFDIENLGTEVLVYFLDLLQYREISNEIAGRFQVTHQSPQLILVKNGKSVYDVSHSDIDAAEIALRL